MPRLAKAFALLAVWLFLAAPALAQEFFSGWWWNPDEPGTGYALQIRELPDKDYDVAYLVWYLYEGSGLNTWSSALLSATGDTMSGTLATYEGWPLEADIVSEVTPTAVGEAILQFSDADTGTLTYFLDGQLYRKSIQRWEPEGETDPRELTGWWWDQDKPGIGWFLEARNDRLFLGWYNYRQFPAVMGGLVPYWYISLDNDFTPADTEYSAPLEDYYDGQTMTGAYTEPYWLTKDEPFAFSLPGDGGAPESIDLTYGGNAYHLTRFEIPDIFGTGCAPVETFHDASEELGETYRPLIRFSAETPCGSAIDTDSIQLLVHDKAVSYSLVEGLEPSQMELFYLTESRDLLGYDHTAAVIASDVNGHTLYYSWHFDVSDY